MVTLLCGMEAPQFTQPRPRMGTGFNFVTYAHTAGSKSNQTKLVPVFLTGIFPEQKVAGSK